MASTYVGSNNIIAENKTNILSDFFSLTKPRLSSLVIFTSFLGLYLAPGNIDLVTAFIAIFATSGLVGGACAINCCMEKDVDALMERTKNRPLPSGRISTTGAVIFGMSLITICLSALFFLINPLTGILGAIATVVYTFMYTPLKKKTSLALFVGAIPGAIPPLMGWTSVTNSLGALGLILFAILFVWQLPHFLSISIYHAQDYNTAQIKILPRHLGLRKTLHRIVVYTFILWAVSLLPYFIGSANEVYRNIIFIMGGVYFLFSLKGYGLKEDSKELLSWARMYFYGSLVYLPFVFIFMVVFK